MRALAVGLVVVAALAGCRSNERTIAKERLSTLVLTPADVGSSYSVFDSGAQVRGDAPPGERSDPARFGRKGGWKIRFKRAGSTKSAPLLIESRADLFTDSGGAKRDLALYKKQFDRLRASGTKVDIGTLDEPSPGAVTVTIAQGELRYVSVAWRDRNVSALVVVSGFAPGATVNDAVALARKQELRLKAAAG